MHASKGLGDKPLVQVFDELEVGHRLVPSTDERRLNKTEKQYLALLRTERQWQWIGIQCVTLKLADDTRYTPDFWTLHANGSIWAHEVKGFWRDDAKVKIKVAARMFPMFNFCVAQKDPQYYGGWHLTDVKP